MNKKIKSIIIGFVMIFSMAFGHANEIGAATTSSPIVSITFDDGFLSTYNYALPVLSERNLTATLYLTSNYVNSGVTDDGQIAMSWEQAQSLQNDYGWEIGGHTSFHQELPLLTTDQIIADLTSANTDYSTYGLDVVNFASPFGAYDNNVLTQVLKYYNSQRGFFDRDAQNEFPYNKAVLQVQSVESGVTLSTIYSWIDQAKANNTWLVLVFHDLAPNLDPNYEYTTTVSDFTAISDYLVNSGIKVNTVEQALQLQGTTISSNDTFADGLNGWSTSSSTDQVTLDTASNGAYGDQNNSVKMTGSSSNSWLFSDLLDATSGNNYELESFYNATGVTSGELGFYIDEYDSTGNWISGHWLGKVANGAIGYFNTIFEKSSNLVEKFRMQVYLVAGSTGDVFIDNLKLINLDVLSTPEPTTTPSTEPSSSPTASPSTTPTVSPTPSSSPTATPSATPTVSPSPTATPTAEPTVTPSPASSPTPTPSVDNLVVNPSFETLDSSGWVTNWIRQSADFNVSSLYPTSGSYSIELTGSTRTHLFSDYITIDISKTYSWIQHVKAILVGAEFGFYIDEYDSTGNWISGQWKGMINDPIDSDITINYKPTSNNVIQIGLQYYYIGGGAESTIYLDDVKLIAQ